MVLLGIVSYLLVISRLFAYQHQRQVRQRSNCFYYFESVFARFYRANIQYKAFGQLVFGAYCCFFGFGIGLLKGFMATLINNAYFIVGDT